MSVSKCTRLVGVACGAGILCAMQSWMLGGGILLVVALPLAIYCRKLMDRQTAEIEALVKQKNAVGHFQCTCFEDAGVAEKNEAYLVLMKEDGIELLQAEQQNGKIIPYGHIDSVQMFTLEQALAMGELERKAVMGRLAASFMLSPGKRKERKKESVQYLVIQLAAGEGEIAPVLSFYSEPADAAINSIQSGTQKDPVAYANKQARLACA